MTSAVLFDYGLTLVTFTYPRDDLLATLEIVRPWLQEATGRPAPAAPTLLREVLEPLEEELDRLDDREVDYHAIFAAGWRRAGLDLDSHLLYRILDLEQRCWERAVRLAPGALEILDRLRLRGIKTAVASNAPFPPEMMRRQLAGNGIGQRVDEIVFSSEIGWRKPSPQLYLAALARLDCAPSEALYVGDKVIEDYQGPRQVGMRAVICTALGRAPAVNGIPTIKGLLEVEDLL